MANEIKGYLYITGQGADPALKGNLNDPLFSRIPTLGACMPNIRRIVRRGDFIFPISGRTRGVQQYVIGGIRVKDKIDALAAYGRFPQNRLIIDDDGRRRGNIIVEADGSQSPLDRHDPGSFQERIKNYIVGSANPVVLTTEKEVELGREQTLGKIADILGRPQRNRVVDVMGRWSKLNEDQVQAMLDWLSGIKSATA